MTLCGSEQLHRTHTHAVLMMISYSLEIIWITFRNNIHDSLHSWLSGIAKIDIGIEWSAACKATLRSMGFAVLLWHPHHAPDSHYGYILVCVAHRYRDTYSYVEKSCCRLWYAISVVHQRESKMHKIIFHEIFRQYITDKLRTFSRLSRSTNWARRVFRPILLSVAINGFCYVSPIISYCGQLHLWSFAVAIVIASLAGPQWLLTEEKIPNINYNGTINYNGKDDGVYITKYTKSSLWILCFAQGRYVACDYQFRVDSRPPICNEWTGRNCSPRYWNAASANDSNAINSLLCDRQQK